MLEVGAAFGVRKKYGKTVKLSHRRQVKFYRNRLSNTGSQINKLEKQNPDLAINVHGWENDSVIVIVQRLSEKEGSVLRITLMLREDKGKWHYRYVKHFSALMYCQKNDKTKAFL